MDDKMLLDALFVMIAVLCLPIGYGRGLTREVFVTAGALIGTTLAASWARPWGTDLADLLDLRAGIGQFAVSLAFVLGSTLMFGYGGAGAAHVGPPRRLSRLSGAILAAINGAIITAFILRDIERLLADADTVRRIEESEFGRLLLREFGWIALGAAGLMLLIVLIGLLFGDRAGSAAPIAATHTGQTWPVSSPTKRQGRRPRLGWGRDDGKVEPHDRGFDPSLGHYQADAPQYAETMPIAPVAPASWSVDRAQGRTTGYDEWLEVGRARYSAEQPIETTSAGVDGTRCLACGERMAADEAFCPRCGRARTER